MDGHHTGILPLVLILTYVCHRHVILEFAYLRSVTGKCVKSGISQLLALVLSLSVMWYDGKTSNSLI